MNFLLRICLTEMWIIHVTCYESYSFPRRYVLYKDKKTWYKSREVCIENGGHLATLYDYSTIPDLDLQRYFNSDYGTFWIGLYFNNNTQVFQWTNGDSVTWSNWRDYDKNKIDPTNTTAICVAATIDKPYDWISRSCLKEHYFLCQYAGGECRFVSYPDASITSHNYMYLYQQTADECKHTCSVQLSGSCKSFEHFPADGRCQFSTENRWTLSEYFGAAPGWVYYHRTCNLGGVQGFAPTISSINATAASCFQTTSVYLTPDVQLVTITVPQSTIVTQTEILTSNIYITEVITSFETIIETTTQVLFMSPSYPLPSVSLDKEPIEELQEIGVIAKEKQKTLKKISMEDKRPSAKYVGYVAIVFLSAVFGSLVLFDLLTLCRNKPSCCLHTKKRKKARLSVRRIGRIKKLDEGNEATKNEEDVNIKEESVPSVSDIPHTSKFGESKETIDESYAKLVQHKVQMHWRPLVWTVTDSGIDGSELSNSPSPSETSSWYYNDIDANRDHSDTSGELDTASKRSYTTHL